MNKKKIKILFTGGGTVGHIKPIFLVADVLKSEIKENNNWADFLYVGSNNGPEKELVEKEKIKFKGISSGKYRRYFSWQNFIDPFRVFWGFWQAFFIILFYRPNVIFAKGGYVTVPVIWAGALLHTPIVSHESDAVMGLANKIALKYAKKVCLGFPLKYFKDLPKDKIVYTGNPVLKITNNKSQATKQKLKTILVMGGSQGSRFINQIIAAIMSELTKKYNIIHVSGKADFEWLSKNVWKNYKLYDFTNKIPELIGKSDLIISRAGANSLVEISAAHKPAILIPLASAANNHQLANAKIYTKANAAVMLTEDKLNPEGLKNLIDSVMEDKEVMKLMALATQNLYNAHASQNIAKVVLEVIK